MTGTSFSHTEAMVCTPPKMTTATSTTMAMPMSHVGTPGAFAAMMPVMADACTAEPVPMVATTANAANATAPVFAHQAATVPSARLKPRSQMYMAPPSMVPAWSRTRYFTDANTSTYLVAMPNTPVIHIQNTAPGPPARMAVATPTMEPVPMVAASAVASAPKFDMSPSPCGSFLNDMRMAAGNLRWMKPVFTVRNRCVPKRSPIMAGPHTNASMLSRISIIARRHCSRTPQCPPELQVFYKTRAGGGKRPRQQARRGAARPQAAAAAGSTGNPAPAGCRRDRGGGTRRRRRSQRACRGAAARPAVCAGRARATPQPAPLHAAEPAAGRDAARKPTKSPA